MRALAGLSLAGLALAGLTFTAACTGVVGDGDDAGSDGVGQADDPLCAAAPAQLRMLSRAELGASIAAAFDVPADSWIGIVPPDPPAEGYVMTHGTSAMSDERLEQILTVSLTLADEVAASLPLRLPCAENDPGDACLQSFVADRLPAMYRRPTTDAEIATVVAIGKAALDRGLSFAEAVGEAAAAMVLAPEHLYRFELAEADGNLSSHAIAELLAFGLTGAPPDEDLRAAAASGALADAATRRAHAARLLDSPAGRAKLVGFVAEWLEITDLDRIDKSATAYPAFDASLKSEMKEAILAFVEHVLFEGDGRLETLLTSTTVFATPALAELYGVTASDVPIEVPNRPGIFTRAAVLAAQSGPDASSPVRRGHLLRHRLLCQEVPPPPPAVDAAIPDASDVTTTRDRYESHLTDPSCVSCHQLMDPLGFAFEGYDGIGRARDSENGAPVDTQGTLEIGGEATEVADAAELVELLAAEPALASCFAENYRMVGIGRPTSYDESCLPAKVLGSLSAADGRLVDIIAAWVASEDFIRRIK